MRHLIILFIGLILSGCSSMNIPAKLNTLSFEKKGQMEVELGASTNSFYQNMGYSLTDNLSIISSGFISYDFLYYNKDRWTGGAIFEYLPYPSKNKYFDLGLGLYRNNCKNFKSIFIGTGLGRAEEEPYPYNSFFIQGNYGVKKNKIESGITTRISYVYYPNTYIGDYLEYHIFGIQPCLYLNITKNRFVYTFNAGTYLTNYNKYSDWFVRDYPQNTLIHLSIGLKYKIGKE